MNHKLYCIIAMVIVSCMLFPVVKLSSAASPQEVVIVPAGEPIQIAFATWMDPGVPYQDYLDAFDMAVDDYGPIKSFSILRNNYDAGCSDLTGETAGNQIIGNTQNLGVVGPFCSGSTRGMAPVLDTAGVVMISYSNTAYDLGNNGWTIFNRVVEHDPEFAHWNSVVEELPNVIAWSVAFNVIYGRPPSEFTKYVYDATSLLLSRIDAVSTLDGSNNLLVDRAELSAAVRNTDSFEGITDLITLETNGDRLNLLTGKVTVPAGEPIQIALATWIDVSAPYQDYRDAFEMAVEDYGLINGFSILRNDYDDGCSQSAGEAAGNEIVTNIQNLGVIGPYCSLSTMGMAPVLDMNDVVMVSYSNTNPNLGFNGWFVFNRVVIADPQFGSWDFAVSNLPNVLAWNNAFNSAYGRLPSTYAKYVYDATMLMLNRIEENSSLDSSNNLIVDRPDLTMSVRNTTAFMGITSNITLEPNGDRQNLLTDHVLWIPVINK